MRVWGKPGFSVFGLIWGGGVRLFWSGRKEKWGLLDLCTGGGRNSLDPEEYLSDREYVPTASWGGVFGDNSRKD